MEVLWCETARRRKAEDSALVRVLCLLDGCPAPSRLGEAHGEVLHRMVYLNPNLSS